MEFMKLDIQLFASGTISLGTSGYLAGQIVWSSTSNGTAANSSNVTASLQLRRTNSYTTTGTWTGNVNINGNNATYSYYGSISNSWVTVSTRTVTVAHNSDGSKVCTISGSGSAPSGTSLAGNTVTGSSNVTLDKIARQATITSAPNFNDEANPTINYSNPAGNNVSSLQACISDNVGNTIYASYRDIPKTSSSYTFELTETERNALRNASPNSNSLNVRFYVKTVISGVTYLSYVNKVMTIINANPLFYNFDFDDINPVTLALTDDSKILISGFSTVQVTIDETDKAVAQKGSSMSKYQFTNGSKNTNIIYSDDENVSGYIENAELGTNIVYAIDSRGNSTAVTKLANQVIEYEGVYIDKTQSSFERNNGQVGTAGVLKISGTFWNNSFGDVQNSIQNVTYRFKKTEDVTWITGTTTITPTVDGNSFTFEGQIASDNLDTTWDLESSYNLEIEIEDELSVASTTFILNSAIPTMSIDKEGVGIMCVYNPSVGGMLQVGGQKITGGRLLAYGSAYNNTSQNSEWTKDNDYAFSDPKIPSKVSKIKDYIGNVLTFDSGTFKVYTRGIVGMVKCTLSISGQGKSGFVGFWWKDNQNTLPTGVELQENGSMVLQTGPASATYGGQTIMYMYFIDTDNDVNFFVNPKFAPYGGNFAPASGGVKCIMRVEVYSK